MRFLLGCVALLVSAAPAHAKYLLMCEVEASGDHPEVKLRVHHDGRVEAVVGTDSRAGRCTLPLRALQVPEADARGTVTAEFETPVCPERTPIPGEVDPVLSWPYWSAHPEPNTETHPSLAWFPGDPPTCEVRFVARDSLLAALARQLPPVTPQAAPRPEPPPAVSPD